MDDIKKNRLIFETLSQVRPIETALVSMWPLDDKYSRVPFLRFRFKDTKKGDNIYLLLEKIINSYEGKIKWRILTHDDTLNYILLPEIFKPYFLAHNPSNKEYYLTIWTEEEYNRIIDTVIMDVPNLAEYIKEFLSDFP